MRFAEVAGRLERLPAHLPEPPALLMPVRLDTPDPPARPPQPVTLRPAAVLVLVYADEAGDARVLLTERTDRGGHHSGEVSFPGGATEPHDDGPVATAIREAAEEVGLDPEAVGLRVLCQLEPFWIPVSGFRVTPIVAVAGVRPANLRPQPAEVARIVEADLAAFAPGAPIEVVERDVRGWPLRYGAYPIDGLLVWGATARILGSIGAWLGAPPDYRGSPSLGS